MSKVGIFIVFVWQLFRILSPIKGGFMNYAAALKAEIGNEMVIRIFGIQCDKMHFQFHCHWPQMGTAPRCAHYLLEPHQIISIKMGKSESQTL